MALTRRHNDNDGGGVMGQTSRPVDVRRRAWLAGAGWSVAGLVAGAAPGRALALPSPLQGVRLVDHEGQALDSGGLSGRLVLMHFIFTQCSTTCPVQVREMARLHDALAAPVKQRVRFVSVSVDALTDTPATLKTFARRMGAVRPGWHFSTGTPADVARLVDRMAVMNPARAGRARPEDHRTSLFLFTPDGQLMQRYRGVPVDVERLIQEMTVLATANGKNS
jgi:cytochrome oxidase Cu insertion factor (SCO1/SenC/PrrC family)